MRSAIALGCIFLLMFNMSITRADDGQTFRELYRIKIENIKNGGIYVSNDQGSQWEAIGKVKRPVTTTNPKGFSASRFGEMGKVVAVAVNAIHIKTGTNTADNTGIVFSLLPANIDNIKGHSYYDAPSSLFTDISPQQGIFGGPWTPFVGSPMYLENEDGKLSFIPPQYVPKLKDRLVIMVLLPEPYPREITFENKYGGAVTVYYPKGDKKIVGEVLRPVQGVGRFVGSQYSGLSRIRANHSGVIDISTSLGTGKVGGFQIIPAKHAMDPEMEKARTKTQWLVVGPADHGDEGLEGTPPLFANVIPPTYTDTDFKRPDWQEKIITRTLVQVKMKGSSEWQSLPSFNFDQDAPLPDDANTALKDVTDIRIVLPML